MVYYGLILFMINISLSILYFICYYALHLYKFLTVVYSQILHNLDVVTAIKKLLLQKQLTTEKELNITDCSD